MKLGEAQIPPEQSGDHRTHETSAPWKSPFADALPAAALATAFESAPEGEI